MDQQKLRTLVFEKTGVRIDVDDPVFALVALNEAVLEETVERHVALLREANDTLAAQVAALRVGAPGQAAAAAPRVASTGQPGRHYPPAVLAAGTAVLAALLVLAGQAALRPAPPAPAPVPQAAPLTPQQDAALRDGAKLARIVEKLDRKTRAAIAAEMQKP
jgi:hypothetical protein